MAREFSGRGHDLALCARRTDRLEALRTALPGRAVIAGLDVTDHDAVFTTFRRMRDELGGLDRVIVNAGLGKGAPVGTGRFDANLATVATNFVAALAQCEAAMEIFREANAGHLVVISSVAAERGLKGAQTVYAATKAALSNLAEGIRSDVADTPIRVSTMAPGYIDTEINSSARARPFAVDEATGSRALAAAIDREPDHAYVPGWPWGLLGPVMQTLPLSILRRIT